MWQMLPCGNIRIAQQQPFMRQAAHEGTVVDGMVVENGAPHAHVSVEREDRRMGEVSVEHLERVVPEGHQQRKSE